MSILQSRVMKRGDYVFLVEAIWSIYRPSSAPGTVNPELTPCSLGLTLGPGVILVFEGGVV